jgi:uncharacterized protein (TIRG00374 family)
LARLGHPLRAGFTALTYIAGFAFTLSPGKIGEVSRARYYTGLDIPPRDVAAAFFVERLLDVLAAALMAVLVLHSLSHYRGVVLMTMAAIGICLLLLVVLPWQRINSSLEQSAGARGRLARLTLIAVMTLRRAHALLELRTVVYGFLTGLAAWTLEGCGLSVIALMFEPAHVDVVTVIGIYGISILFGALSSMPGGLGSTEAVMTALLAGQGYPISESVVITLTCRFLTLWLGVFLGVASATALRNHGGLSGQT